MTQPRSKRLRTRVRTRGRVLACLIALVAALGLTPANTPSSAAATARPATVPAAPVGSPATEAPKGEATAAAGRLSPTPHGFASLAGGTTGGAGGEVVTVTDQASLARYAAADGRYIIRQALAMKTTGDRIVFDNTAFEGNQDTLMTNSPDLRSLSRVYVHDSSVEGDVDFLYGRATTVFDDCVIKALSRGSSSNNGYITAASTWKENPYGFLITDSRIVSDAPAGTFHLGRPWHPGGEPDAIGQVLIRDTELPAAIKDSPWTDMSGFPWQEARFTEYRNYGPGATVTADRPQMSADEAARHTVTAYLAGPDGWAPHR